MEVLGGLEGLVLVRSIYTPRGTRPRRIHPAQPEEEKEEEQESEEEAFCHTCEQCGRELCDVLANGFNVLVAVGGTVTPTTFPATT